MSTIHRTNTGVLCHIAYVVTSLPGAAPRAVERGASSRLQRNPNSTFRTRCFNSGLAPQLILTFDFLLFVEIKAKSPVMQILFQTTLFGSTHYFLDDFILQRKVFSLVRWLSWWRYLTPSLRTWVLPQDPHGRRRIKSQSPASCPVTSAHVLWNVSLPQMSE